MKTAKSVRTGGKGEPYQPRPEDKFTFGLWTLGNRGRAPGGNCARIRRDWGLGGQSARQ